MKLPSHAPALAFVLAAATSGACAPAIPETTYYRLVPPPPTERADNGVVMMVDELRVDAAYDDERIAYRTSPYTLEYYEYHRWSAPPGMLVSDFLRSAYANTGEFARVIRDPEPEAAVVLSGRVIALEEVDRTPEVWWGHVELELELRDADTRELLWSKRVRERERLHERSPEGLAQAAGKAMRRVVDRTAPQIARAAQEAAEIGAPRAQRPINR